MTEGRTGMNGPCAYCGIRRAVNRDHVVPRSLQRKCAEINGRLLPEHLSGTVKSCFSCNMLKGTRKLVPQSWAHKIPELKDLLPGEWRVWQGGVHEHAFAAVHK